MKELSLNEVEQVNGGVYHILGRGAAGALAGMGAYSMGGGIGGSLSGCGFLGAGIGGFVSGASGHGGAGATAGGVAYRWCVYISN